MYMSPFEPVPGPYRVHYHCFSLGNALCPKAKLGQENGGKIILPPSALDHLTRLNIDFPMFFRLTYKSRSTHSGVLEFTAQENCCFLPDWMLRTLGITSQPQLICVEYVNLPVATFVRFQPESADFYEIYDHKAVLENALRNFACLTCGDKISIKYNDRDYELNILATEPNNAVSILECDMRVDFAEPVNGSVKQASPTKDEAASAGAKQESSPGAHFPGEGRRLDGKAGTKLWKNPAKPQERGIADYDYKPNKLTFFRKKSKNVVEVPNKKEDETGFKAFSGQGRSLRS